MQQCTADKIIMSYHKLCKNMICMPSLKKIKSQVEMSQVSTKLSAIFVFHEI